MLLLLTKLADIREPVLAWYRDCKFGLAVDFDTSLSLILPTHLLDGGGGGRADDSIRNLDAVPAAPAPPPTAARLARAFAVARSWNFDAARLAATTEAIDGDGGELRDEVGAAAGPVRC